MMPCRMLLIENFIPPEEKDKIKNRAVYDEEDDCWNVPALTKEKSVFIHTHTHIYIYIYIYMFIFFILLIM